MQHGLLLSKCPHIFVVIADDDDIRLYILRLLDLCASGRSWTWNVLAIAQNLPLLSEVESRKVFEDAFHFFRRLLHFWLNKCTDLGLQ